jgi:hypothetical protein
MSDNFSINEFAVKFLNGEFDDPAINTQIYAGWYDWFCRDVSLVKKTKSLGAKVLQLMKSSKIDCENMYVFFKNNSPVVGPLYDDFRICSMETGDVIYTVTPKSGHNGMAEVWGRENDFQEPLITGTWNDVKKYFGV